MLQSPKLEREDGHIDLKSQSGSWELIWGLKIPINVSKTVGVPVECSLSTFTLFKEQWAKIPYAL